MIEYEGYSGVIEFLPEEETFHGRVANIRDVISFYGDSVEELKQAMAQAVDDYLAYCRGRGIAPSPIRVASMCGWPRSSIGRSPRLRRPLESR